MKRGLTAVRREPGRFLTVGAFIALLGLVQFLLILGLGLRSLEGMMEDEKIIRVETNVRMAGDAVQRFYGALRSLPSVATVTYVTKEQAYAAMQREDPQSIAAWERASAANPLRDSFLVRLLPGEKPASVLAFLRRDEWAPLLDPGSVALSAQRWEENADELAVLRLIHAASFLFIGISLAALLLMLIETVRRGAVARKDELLVKHLAGAQMLSVLVPFAAEIAVLLAVALFTSFLVVGLLLFLVPFISGSTAFTESAQAVLAAVLPLFVVGELICLPFLAFIGAWFGIRPLLRMIG